MIYKVSRQILDKELNNLTFLVKGEIAIMKNILIMGIGRAGKTTLGKMIKNKYNCYNLIHSDSLKWALIRAKDEEEYYRENVNIQKNLNMGSIFKEL